MPRGADFDPPQRSTTLVGSQSQRDKGNRDEGLRKSERAPPWSKCLRSVAAFQELPGGGPTRDLGRKGPSRN